MVVIGDRVCAPMEQNDNEIDKGWVCVPSPEKVEMEGREEVEEEGGELVQAVEDEAVLPHHDG